MLMKLTSFGDVEYGPPGSAGEQDAVGRIWSLTEVEGPTVLDLFVESPGALPVPKLGRIYRVTMLPEGPVSVKMGLLGIDRSNDRWYRIVSYPGDV